MYCKRYLVRFHIFSKPEVMFSGFVIANSAEEAMDAMKARWGDEYAYAAGLVEDCSGEPNNA